MPAAFIVYVLFLGLFEIVLLPRIRGNSVHCGRIGHFTLAELLTILSNLMQQILLAVTNVYVF